MTTAFWKKVAPVLLDRQNLVTVSSILGNTGYVKGTSMLGSLKTHAIILLCGGFIERGSGTVREKNLKSPPTQLSPTSLSALKMDGVGRWKRKKKEKRRR